MLRFVLISFLSLAVFSQAQTLAKAGAGDALAVPRHKIQVSDPAAARRLASQGARLIADYGGFELYDASPAAAASVAGRVEWRDNYNVIRLNASPLDTSLPRTQALRHRVGAFAGKRLHLVHFAGPVLPAWREALRESGAQIVSYIPQNAYLVYGDAGAIGRIQSLAATAPHIQWEGAYLDDYKIQPRARTVDGQGRPRQIGTDLFAIQMVQDEGANGATRALLEGLKLAPWKRENRVLHYWNVVGRFAAGDLARIAARPDVISIAPYFTPRKLDERQDQIIAGNLAGNVPAGPGYLAWLAGKGFTQGQFTASGFTVDVSDSGIDDGTTLPRHFGLYVNGDLTGDSRVVYNRLEGTPNAGSTLMGCDGHGNINTHIIGGYDDLAGFPFADSSDYHYGLGVCPFVQVGSSVIFDPDNYTFPDFSQLALDAYESGSRIINNSWGGGGNDGIYDTQAQEYDMLVRDADASAPGNQEMVIVFAAGNDGPGSSSVATPGTAKNVITVGAADNVQPFGGSDGCSISDADASDASQIVGFSGRGPCNDGRSKPDLVAPGTHVSGGVFQAAKPGPLGMADPCFLNDGTGVCGGVGSQFFPDGQEYYTASSGTSHSTPCVSGGCALLRQYFINNSLTPPSPAMTKAYLMNAARYLTGAGADDTLWSPSQGMGEMDLGVAFDGTARALRDEVPADLFTVTGQTRMFAGAIADTNQPFRVTVAWTDAPGSTTAAAYNNDLDLTVTAGGNTYKGNVFNGAWSTTGGAADAVDNVESVFLPAGVAGTFTVVVTAANINSAGVPDGEGTPNQDFALVMDNATVVTVGDATVTASNCFQTNGVIVPGDAVTLTVTLQNSSTVDITNLVATLPAGGGVNAPSGPQSLGVLQAEGPGVSATFTFTASGSCGGVVTATLQLQDGARALGTVNINLPLGRPTRYAAFRQNFDAVTLSALPAGWGVAFSGGQGPWVSTNDISDSPPNAAFASAGDQVGISDLVSPAIFIASPFAQLIFRHDYNLEADPMDATLGYDGGALEMQIGGGGFADILSAGGSFASGGYTRTIASDEGAGNNPLAGRAAWSGNSGGFVTTIINLPAAAAGNDVQFKWRCGTDDGNLYGSTGWWVDSIEVTDGGVECCDNLTPAVILNPGIAGGNVVFSFQTVAYQTYVIEYKDTLSDAAWTPLEYLTGDGSVQTIVAPLTGTQRYYRIRSP